MVRGSIRENKVVIANNIVDVPRRIAMIRRFQDMTQDELAKKLGVTHSCVCAWEKGRTKPSNDMIHKICDKTGVSIVEFVTGKIAYYEMA